MMNSNPLQIAKGSIFICGNNLDTTGKHEFQKMEAYLLKKGYDVIDSSKITYHAMDVDMEKIMITRKRVAYLAMCDKVVTLTGWEKDIEALRIVQIARAMDKPVILAEGFERWENNQAYLKTLGHVA